jgi:arylsulfatase A-like enzyme
MLPYPHAGSTTDAMVSWVDVAPTILDWIGIKETKGMQGRSFLPVLK